MVFSLTNRLFATELLIKKTKQSELDILKHINSFMNMSFQLVSSESWKLQLLGIELFEAIIDRCKDQPDPELGHKFLALS